MKRNFLLGRRESSFRVCICLVGLAFFRGVLVFRFYNILGL